MVKIHSKSEKSELCYNQMLANLEVEKAAWQSGFYQLVPKKIFAENLLVGFCLSRNLGGKCNEKIKIHFVIGH